MRANDKQVGGSHYKVSGISHWDLVHDHNVGYLAGNASKYLTRFRRKAGLQDLEKSLHYVEKMIEKYSDGVGVGRYGGSVPEDELLAFFVDNDIEGSEREPIRLIFNWMSVSDLKVAKCWIETLIAEFDCSAPTSSYVNQDR